MFLALLVVSLSAAAAQDRLTFTSEAANFKVTYPTTWTKKPPPNPLFQLSLQKEADVILVSGLETNDTVEEMIATVLQEQRARDPNLKETSRKEVKVAGEKAYQILFETQI